MDSSLPKTESLGSNQEDLYTLVYEELHRLASAKMSREFVYSTLQSTALVNEAWLKLGGDKQPHWQNRAHFFASAAEAMRQILVDRARKRNRKRHGSEFQRVAIENLDDLRDPVEADNQLLMINEALEKLAIREPRKAELVKLRFFFGLSLEETASTLGVSVSTAQRWWTYSRSWFYNEINST